MAIRVSFFSMVTMYRRLLMGIEERLEALSKSESDLEYMVEQYHGSVDEQTKELVPIEFLRPDSKAQILICSIAFKPSDIIISS